MVGGRDGGWKEWWVEDQKTWVDVPKMYTLTKVGYLHNSSKVEFVFMLDCGFSRNTPRHAGTQA